MALAGVAGVLGAGFWDGFDGEQVDGEFWDVVLPYSNFPVSRAEVGGGRLELFRRGILEGRSRFEGGVDIEGSFRFSAGDDILTLVLRSGLEVVDQNERLGVQVLFQNKDSRVLVLSEPFSTNRHIGSFQYSSDGEVPFRVTDDGSLLRVYSRTLTNLVMAVEVEGGWGDRFALYNSISTSGGISVDYISAEPLETTILLDGKRARGGDVVRQGDPVTVTLQGHWLGGQVFYTLDGTAPSFVKQRYDGPFVLSESARIRAVTYSADFQRSMGSAVVDFEVLPRYKVEDGTLGGGVVEMEPAGGLYYEGTEVTLTARAGAGWEFMGWEGGGDTNPVVRLVVTNDVGVKAIFGTRPEWVVVGSEPGAGGSILVEPEMEVVPFGTVLQLNGVPDEGCYFFGWANAVTGNVSPVFLNVDRAPFGVTALFGKLESTQVRLDLEISGLGLVLLDPPQNVFERGETVRLEAVAGPGMMLGGWSGDLVGGAARSELVMDGDKRVTVTFVEAFRLGVRPLSSGDVLILDLDGEDGAVYTIEKSPDWIEWESTVVVTNRESVPIPVPIEEGARWYYRARQD